MMIDSVSVISDCMMYMMSDRLPGEDGCGIWSVLMFFYEVDVH